MGRNEAQIKIKKKLKGNITLVPSNPNTLSASME